MNILKKLLRYRICKNCKGEYRKNWHLFLGKEFCSKRCFDCSLDPNAVEAREKLNKEESDNSHQSIEQETARNDGRKAGDVSNVSRPRNSQGGRKSDD